MITKEFDSLTAIASYIMTTDRADGAGNDSYEQPAARSWDLGMGLNGAIEMAAKGGHWPKGAEDIMKTHMEMAALKNEGKVPAEDYEVVGHTLDISAYLSGQPDCYINEGEEDDNKKPVLSIGVQCGRTMSMKSKDIMNRGSAILSVIDDLEDQGYRVELWALWNQAGSGETSFRTLIKGAEDSWSPSAVAFALCHPAFNRRLMWRVAETEEELNTMTRTTYGTGASSDAEANKGFDVFIEYQRRGYDSARDALRDIQSETKRQLATKER